MSTAEKRRYTTEEYLALERASDTKHEYYQGEIFAMTGASLSHNRIVVNLLKLLGNSLNERDCEVLAGDMRVKVPTGLYTYPDLTVVCGEPQLEDEAFDTLLNPKLIVEVLSQSTEAYDRGEKFAQYRTIESLEQYMLVSQQRYRVEVFTKEEDGRWVLSDAGGLDAGIELPVFGCTLPLEEVYFRVDLSQSTENGTND